jgi:hypothetical protein
MTSPDAHEPALSTAQKSEFSTAEIGALAHLYRGEVYRSTVWRTRLDSSTNWAVVTTGIALSATYSSAEAERKCAACYKGGRSVEPWMGRHGTSSFLSIGRDKLFITTAPFQIPNSNGSEKMVIGNLLWERDQ